MTVNNLQLGTDANEEQIADALTKLAEDVLDGDAHCEVYKTATSINAEEAVEYELSVAFTVSDESRFTDVFDHHAIENS